MKKFLSILLFALLILQISATCSDSQIDINTAPIEELDSLSGIGPVKAGEIINSRPFESIDELINVWGIGEITLQKIKAQGLACVAEEKQDIEEEPNIEPINEPEMENDFENVEINEPEKTKPKNVVSEVIKLNPQTIKGENDKESSDKSNYALYGFAIFCIFLGLLFVLKKKRNNKNEFR